MPFFELSILECPNSRTIDAADGSQALDGTSVRSAHATYPIINGILDLRMPTNRSMTRYDEVLPECRGPTVDTFPLSQNKPEARWSVFVAASRPIQTNDGFTNLHRRSVI